MTELAADPTTSEGAAFAARLGEPPSEADLTVGRTKPSSIDVSTAYRSRAVARGLRGNERLRRFSLDAAWLTHRFPSASQGLQADFLRRWIPAEGSVLNVGCGNGRCSRSRLLAVAGRDR